MRNTRVATQLNPWHLFVGIKSFLRVLFCKHNYIYSHFYEDYFIKKHAANEIVTWQPCSRAQTFVLASRLMMLWWEEIAFKPGKNRDGERNSEGKNDTRLLSLFLLLPRSSKVNFCFNDFYVAETFFFNNNLSPMTSFIDADFLLLFPLHDLPSLSSWKIN